ncbi:MAG: lipopolysaccharide biosynthesis protein [Thermoleophilaceae bacterium]
MTVPGSAARFGLRRTMTRGASVMVVLTLAASVVNYASNVVFSRLLTTEEFGDFTAVLAFAVIAAVPTAAAQTMIAQRVARNFAEGQVDQMRWFVRHALGHVAMVAAMAGILYALTLPLVIELLRIRAPGPAIALLPLIVLTFILPVALGVLQGMDRFVAFGVMTLAIALARIGFGVPWAAAGGGSGGAVGGQAIGLFVVLAGAAWILRAQLMPRGSGAATSGMRRPPTSAALSASAAFIAFAVISNLDVVLAKLFLGSHESGLYAALVTLEKIVIFLPGAVAVVMVPNAARARHSSDESRRVLRIAALLTIVTALVAAVPAAVAPEFVLELMFGSKYLDAADGVLPIVCAGAGLALLFLLVTYVVAIDDRRWTWIVAFGVALQVVGIAAFHDAVAQVATVQAVVVIVILVLNEAMFHSLLRPRFGKRRR